MWLERGGLYPMGKGDRHQRRIRIIVEMKKHLTNRLRVKGFGSHITFSGHQELVREYRLFGVKIWTKILDREEIPQYALISVACLGDESGWKSKFAHIKEAWVK